MLKVESIHTYYGQSHILHGVDLSIAEGQVVTLMGRNGMGKTTTVRSIMGLNKIAKGNISFMGKNISNIFPHKISYAGIGLVPEGRQIFPILSVEENLKVCAKKPRHASIHHYMWTLSRIYNFFPKLLERKNQKANTLSGGEQQLLAIARALMTNPKLLILDEATEGLAPLVRQDIWDCITRLKQENLSILIIDKNISNLVKIANYHYVLEKGRIIWQGNSEAVKNETRFAEKYLGV